MSETGIEADIVRNGQNPKGARSLTRGLAGQRHGYRKALRGGVAACGFMLALLAPVSVDIPAGGFSVNAALAGSGDGNYGKGKGNGGPNDGLPGKRRGEDNQDDDDDDDDGIAQDSPRDGGHEGGDNDDANGMADDNAVETASLPSNSPAAAPVAGMPTISQLFALGDEASVSAEAELELIANGWNTAD